MDIASRTGLQNDGTVGATWLCTDGRHCLLDVCHEPLNYPDVRVKTIEAAARYDPWEILIEDVDVGIGLLQDVRIKGLNAVEVKPTPSKETRALIQTPKFKTYRVLFPKSAPCQAALVAEILAFSAGRHADQVDFKTQACAYVSRADADVVYIRFGRTRIEFSGQSEVASPRSFIRRPRVPAGPKMG